MDPRGLLRPVGPRPPGVYWLRRATLLAALAAVIVLVAYACGSGTSTGRKETGAAPRPSSPAPATASPSTSPTPPGRCHRRDLEVTAATADDTYPAGTAPRMSAVVRNASDQTCTFTTTSGKRVWTITSGADRVWSSADCPQPGVRARKRLKPGKTIAYALVWNRHRSAAGCPADTPEAGPGTYRLVVTVNGVPSPDVIFHLAG